MGPTTLTDNVTLAGSGGITITPAGNTLTIASTGAGNAILNQTTPQQANASFNIDGNGLIGGNVGIGTLTPNNSKLNVVSTGHAVRGDSINGIGLVGTSKSQIFSAVDGNNTSSGAGVTGSSTDGQGVEGISTNSTGVSGLSSNSIGVYGSTNGSSNFGTGVYAGTNFQGAKALWAKGSSWFQGDTTPLPAASGRGIVIGYGSGASGGYVSAFDYGTFTAKDLWLNNAGGNVGIGTTTPQAKLDITPTGDGADLLRFSTDRPWLFRQVRSGATTGLQLAATSGQKAFEIATTEGNNVATFFADATVSKVGIATTAPTATLDVNGNVRVRNITAGPPVGYICGDSSFRLVSCETSSLRFKTDVRPFSDGLNILRQLHPISYRWKDGGAYDIGLAAEDVANVAPSFAVRNQAGEIEGVRYQRLNILLINAVNQQQYQIERQQQQIETLLEIVCGGGSKHEICQR